MATRRRIEANRGNAKKSTAPRTPGGKAGSSINALKHGLTASRAVILDEDRKELESLGRRMIAEPWAMRAAAGVSRSLAVRGEPRPKGPVPAKMK